MQRRIVIGSVSAGSGVASEGGGSAANRSGGRDRPKDKDKRKKEKEKKKKKKKRKTEERSGVENNTPWGSSAACAVVATDTVRPVAGPKRPALPARPVEKKWWAL